MDIRLYRQYLNEYVQKAINEGDGKVSRITELLYEEQVKGLLVTHREEKLRALSDAQQAFSEHRHWPLEIIISHLGVEIDLPG